MNKYELEEKLTQKDHIKLDLNNTNCESETFNYENYKSLNNRLNEAKENLKTIAKNKDFITFKNTYDIYRQLKYIFETEYNCIGASNASLKFHELICEYDLLYIIDSDENNPVIFLNAELPGGFIKMILHYNTYFKIKLNWLASSWIDNNPSNKKPLLDSYNYVKEYKNQWLMNKDMNGDMTDIKNILYIENKLKNINILLYTHDAGIDVSEDYNNQEIINYRLHFGSMLCGLLVLKKEGNILAKQYTFFESSTYNLIYIYKQLFEEFYICKPMTSRASNSEIYLIGKKYKGLSPELRNYLINLFKNDTEVIISNDSIFQSYLNSIYTIAKIIYEQQIMFLKEMTNHYEKYKQNNIKYKKIIMNYRIPLYKNYIENYPLN